MLNSQWLLNKLQRKFSVLYKGDLRGHLRSQLHFLTEARGKILEILVFSRTLSPYRSLSQLRFYNIGKYIYHMEEQKSKISLQTNCIELITNKSILRFLAPLSIALLQIENFLTRSFDCWLYNFNFFFLLSMCQIMLIGIKTAWSHLLWIYTAIAKIRF